MASTPESIVLNAVCEYLALRGHFFSRTNNNPIVQSDKYGVRMRKLPKYTRRGWPDICLISNGMFYGIEVKSEKGKLRSEQEELGHELIKHGGIYIVARGIEDVQRYGL